jgi:GNAT superfamily N-acetyltransferase
MNLQLVRLLQGYAALLDAPVEAFYTDHLSIVSTPIRDLPEWANWIQPIWLFGFEQAVVCSVSPRYAEAAQVTLAEVTAATLLSDTVLACASMLEPRLEWVRCELFYYPHEQPPLLQSEYKVERLQAGEPGAERHLRTFDGGVYVIRDKDREITSAAFIKNKGIIREIAVGTDAAYRRQGRGKAVVLRAIQEIAAQGCVATYWPDGFDNLGSYTLAKSVGMVKVAEMLFCCYEADE